MQTQETRIYNLIKNSGSFGVENYKLSRIALSYTKVISNLREDGHNIYGERQRLPNGRYSGTWKYYLNQSKRHAGNVQSAKVKVNPLIRELMIIKSRGRFGAYNEVCRKLKELGV
jgi:hypothetical protein